MTCFSQRNVNGSDKWHFKTQPLEPLLFLCQGVVLQLGAAPQPGSQSNSDWEQEL